jgi:hypothetical protein
MDIQGSRTYPGVGRGLTIRPIIEWECRVAGPWWQHTNAKAGMLGVEWPEQYGNQ